MGFWEFLIQKEGDRSWLPLESPDVEVLEGRYRVMARSNRVNATVEIQISHIAIAEDPPKRRTQKRSSQTNFDGLMVVIPFTRLQPGIWEVTCASDLMSDFGGDGWQHTVKLQVLSHASEATDNWEPDWQSSDELESPSSTQSLVQALPQNPVEASIPPSPRLREPLDPPVNDVAGDSTLVEPTLERLTRVPPSTIAPSLVTPSWVTELTEQAELTEQTLTDTNQEPRAKISDAIVASSAFQTAERLSQDVIDSVFQDLDTPKKGIGVEGIGAERIGAERIGAEGIGAEEIDVEEAAATAQTGYPALRLQLDQRTYMAQRGQPLTLIGQVERSPEKLASSQELPISAALLQVCIRLQDPQTAQILVDEVRSLSLTTLPSPFECTITIPSNYQTRLLLGDLVLSVGATELATESFSVTADLSELLELLANASESDQVQPPLEFTTSATVADLDLTFLEFLQSPKPMLQFQPAANQVMPPQISPTSTSPHSVKLGATPSGFPKESILPLTVATKPTIAINTASAPKDEAQSSMAAHSSHPSQNQTQLFDLAKEPRLADQLDLPTVVMPSTLPDLVLDEANISPQTWQTSTQADHPSPSTPSQSTSPEDTAFRSLNLQNRFLSRLNALAEDAELASWLRHDLAALPVEAPLGLDTDLAALEVVVEDDSLPPTSDRPTPVEPPAALVLPDDEPVPAPKLSIPLGELISGQSIFVTVSIPDVRSRIYVKLWVLDRQTRSLLDGPRWFMAFVPDGMGNLETRTQITVPYGCLEVLFEAIAIEMMSKRESHKTGVDRTVIPPDMPSLLSTELEIE